MGCRLLFKQRMGREGQELGRRKAEAEERRVQSGHEWTWRCLSAWGRWMKREGSWRKVASQGLRAPVGRGAWKRSAPLLPRRPLHEEEAVAPALGGWPLHILTTKMSLQLSSSPPCRAFLREQQPEGSTAEPCAPALPASAMGLGLLSRRLPRITTNPTQTDKLRCQPTPTRQGEADSQQIKKSWQRPNTVRPEAEAAALL